jgi:hypothetical protein
VTLSPSKGLKSFPSNYGLVRNNQARKKVPLNESLKLGPALYLFFKVLWEKFTLHFRETSLVK